MEKEFNLSEELSWTEVEKKILREFIRLLKKLLEDRRSEGTGIAPVDIDELAGEKLI